MLCDNQAYVNKLTWLLEDEYHQHGLHKNTEAESLSIILQILPSKFKINPVKRHQDDKARYQDLDIKAKLNLDADKIAISSISINTHAISLPFALYIDNFYTYHCPDHTIRVASHKHEAQAFLRTQYKGSSRIFHSINWTLHASCLLSIPDSLKQFSLRFIHHRIPIGKMIFGSPTYASIVNYHSPLHPLMIILYLVPLPLQLKIPASTLSINYFHHYILILCYNNIFFSRCRNCTISKIKQKWVSRKLIQYETWSITELQK